MRKENGTYYKVAEFKSESISQQNNEVPLTALSGLPKGNGEFCHIERIFRESGMFSFCGKEKVETADDVAYIFKELENASVEYKRESLQNDTNIYEMDDIRFRIEDNYTQEELLIIDLARANGMYLKAPNGEVSNLSPEQWAQVRTTAFKNWFGDWENTPENASKAIDENGEPIVVYHGSSQWFTSFKNEPEHHSDAPDKSIFMSNDRELSNSYISWYGESDGSLPPMAHDVYLNENDPRHKQYSWGVYREGGIYPLFANIKHPLTIDFKGKLWIDAGDGRDINEIVKDAQLSGGYDGVIARNIKDVGITDLDISELPVSNDYVAFNSNQVKSAISNIGDFSLENNDIRYRFIGEKGAANLDRAEEATFRLDNLSLAKEMEFVGKDPILIKFATGWERGADNLWRYEDRDLNIQTEYVGKYKDNRTGSNIAAYYMHNRMSVGSVGRLSDFISDDNLFMAYPEIADWEVKMLGNGAKFSGVAGNGMIALSKGYFSEVYEILNLEDVTTARARIPRLYERIPEEMREVAMDLVDAYGGEQDRMSNTAYNSIVELCPEIEEMIKALDDIPLEKQGEFLGYRLNDIAKRVLTHEVQHAIQHIEGFAHGGSPMQFSDSSTFEYDIRKFNSVVEGVIQGNEYEKLGELLNSDKYSGFRESFSSDRDKEVIRVLKMWYSDLPEKVFMENYHCSVENGRKGTTEEQYHKLSGEVEARNVESRMKMTPEERRNSLAKLTEDVRREDQIFLKNSLSERMHSSKAEFIPAIEGLANSLHISVNIINGINEIPDSMARRKIESGSNVKGWFVPTTSTVNIYLPNISDLNDAQRTVFHEVVAHYGLRKMFGEHFDVFLDNVYNNAEPVIQRKILHATNGEPNKRLMATEEYLAKLAERGFSDPDELSLWKKIKLAFIDMLRQANVNLNFKLTDNSLRYILYKSYLNLTQDVSSNNLNLLNMEEKSKEVAQATEIYDDLDPFWQAIEDHWFPDEKESKKQEEQQEQSRNQEFRMPHTVKGVEISAENRQKLLQGERVFIEGMISSKGTPFNAYMYIDQKKKTLAFDLPEKKEKKKENIDTPQAEAIKKPKKKKLGL